MVWYTQKCCVDVIDLTHPCARVPLKQQTVLMQYTKKETWTHLTLATLIGMQTGERRFAELKLYHPVARLSAVDSVKDERLISIYLLINPLMLSDSLICQSRHAITRIEKNN